MKQELSAVELTKKLDRWLLGLHAAQTPASLSQAAFGCAHSLVGASEALLAFSPGPGLAAKLFHFTTRTEPTEAWVDESWLRDPLVKHLFERQSAGPLNLRRIFTETEMARSPFAAKWLQRPELPHIVALSGIVRETSSVLMFLFRDAADGDYTPAKIEQLDWFYSHFKIAWLRVFVREETLAIHHSLQSFLRQAPNGLVVLNWDFDVVYRNAEAVECCALWNFGQNGARKVQPSTVFRCPDEVVAVCENLKATFLNGRNLPDTPAHESADATSQGTTLTGECASPNQGALRAVVRLVVLKSSALEKPVFQIRISRRAAAAPAVASGQHLRTENLPEQFASLTVREREVVDCICRGLSNEAIAQQLSKSVPTVKNQLHSIFQKLSVSSRAALMALVQSQSVGSRQARKSSQQ